jgi:hypothetical protein
MSRRVNLKDPEPDDNGVLTVRTHPCPRCQSRNTRVTIINNSVLLRWCQSCRYRWDYIPEFAPRRRKVRRESRGL